MGDQELIRPSRDIPVNIEDEMRKSYLDYAMSVIIGRALPDVRDGLKPVHRRILYAMYKEGNTSDKRYIKCAGVVGGVIKKYHPHGDAAVYDTLVRMAQDFNMRYPLIDGQGNSLPRLGGWRPAAGYRYTECRLAKLAEEMLADIEKDTVDFTPNFDELHGGTRRPPYAGSRPADQRIRRHCGGHGHQDSAAQPHRNRRGRHSAGEQAHRYAR